MKKILFTGGSGRFAKVFRLVKNKYRIEYPSKKKFNIESFNSVLRYLKKSKPDYLIHCAALSRPMKIHEKNIIKSVSLNIIGTANIVKECFKNKIKLIYISTNYLYPGNKGNYKETDALLPWNNYGWSKLGAECAVQMYKNSLIVRACVSEKPFLHKTAFNNVKASFLYHDDAAKIVLKLINKTGMINLGGKSQTIFNFAKKTNPSIKKSNMKNNVLPKNLTISLSKLKGLL